MVGEFPSLSVGLVSQRLLRQRRGCDLHGIGGIRGAGRAGAGLYAMFSTETRNGVFGNGKRTPPPTPRRPPRCYARQRGRDFHGCKHSLSASKDAKWKQPTRWARGSLENRYQFYKTRDSAKRKHRREKPGVVSRYVGVRSRGCRASRNFLQTRSPPGGTDLLVRADSPGRFGESKTYVADTSGIFHVYNCISTESLTRVGPRNYPRRSQGGARCPPSKGPVLFGGAKTVCPTTVDGNTEDPATVCALAVPNGTTVCALMIPAGSP
jgi:hypothetical protein